MKELVNIQKEDILKVQNNYKVSVKIIRGEQIICSLIRNKQVGMEQTEGQESKSSGSVNLSGEFF